ncbi:MAG: hypothetical protein ACO1Q7_02880 [Gemmatimonas sp.]
MTIPVDEPRLDERRLLDVWSAAATLARPQQEVSIVAGVTGQTTDQASRLTIGERDRLLMLLHERTFGGRYDCEARCMSCGMGMAFSFAASDLGLNGGELDAESLVLTEGRVVVKLKLPTSADLAACLTHERPAAALFARCVKVQSSPAHRLAQMSPNDLPASLRQSAIERLAALDPHADLLFELECQSCETDNKVMFDPVVALMRQAEEFLPAVPVTTRAVPEFQNGPGASISDFLERLVHRHRVNAIVHQLRVDAAVPE